MQNALYASLVSWLRGTLNTAPENVDAILAQSRRSYADLMADAMARGLSESPKCEKCGGSDFSVITSRPSGSGSQSQRVKCDACGSRKSRTVKRASITRRKN